MLFIFFPREQHWCLLRRATPATAEAADVLTCAGVSWPLPPTCQVCRGPSPSLLQMCRGSHLCRCRGPSPSLLQMCRGPLTCQVC